MGKGGRRSGRRGGSKGWGEEWKTGTDKGKRREERGQEREGTRGEGDWGGAGAKLIFIGVGVRVDKCVCEKS